MAAPLESNSATRSGIGTATLEGSPGVGATLCVSVSFHVRAAASYLPFAVIVGVPA